MRSWPRSTERLLGVSARLLAGASVLSTVGVGLAVRLSWQQTGQSFGPDGPIEGGGVPFAQHVTMVMLDLSYRPIGVQLLLASALVGAAMVVLHRIEAWPQVRLLRWEVLGAGLVTLVPVLALVLANLYVLTPSDDPDRSMLDYMGPQPLNEPVLGNLPPLVATVLTLTGAALWWLRLEPAAEGAADDTDDADADADDDAGDDRDASDEPEAAVSLAASARASLDPSDSLGNGAAMGYPQDWSPEDFRPPR